MKKILITGAAGYLGARLSKYLAENGNSVTAFIRSNVSKNCEWAKLMKEVIVGDIRDEKIVTDLAKRNFDVVIHLISLDHHKSEDSPIFVSSINVIPTWNLLDSFTKNGLGKFIYFSTQQVLGELPSRLIEETTEPNPKNNYGLTHLLSEEIVNYYNNKTNTKCINARLSSGYGSPVFNQNNCWWLVINDLCKTAFTKNKIKLLSDGSPQRDFIHILDICRAIEIMIESGSNYDENIFHIASGKTLNILELAHIVKKVFSERYSKEIPIYLPDESVSNNSNKFKDSERFMIDIKRIKELGFQNKVSLQAGVNEIFEYFDS